ncbi:MAG: acyl-CoA dehydrogenase family protein, partial [Flavobacteriaceae bacterium]|nr:acyl-CoA dehydrogenase family protein [Candidatus Onthonaster equi]
MNNTTDYFKIDDLLTEEHLIIRQSVKDFVDKEIMPVIDECAHEHRDIPNLMQKLGAIGALGPYIPTEYGGAGLDQISYGIIMQELERGDSAVRSAASVQSSLVMYPIYSYGSEEQKQKFLPKLASG